MDPNKILIFVCSALLILGVIGTGISVAKGILFVRHMNVKEKQIVITYNPNSQVTATEVISTQK